jgi:hypothetical protein
MVPIIKRINQQDLLRILLFALWRSPLSNKLPKFSLERGENLLGPPHAAPDAVTLGILDDDVTTVPGVFNPLSTPTKIPTDSLKNNPRLNFLGFLFLIFFWCTPKKC